MLASLIRFGHAPSDTAGDSRIRSIFFIAMIGVSLVSVELACLGNTATMRALNLVRRTPNVKGRNNVLKSWAKLPVPSQ